jgi:hypothetical protein
MTYLSDDEIAKIKGGGDPDEVIEQPPTGDHSNQDHTAQDPSIENVGPLGV